MTIHKRFVSAVKLLHYKRDNGRIGMQMINAGEACESPFALQDAEKKAVPFKGRRSFSNQLPPIFGCHFPQSTRFQVDGVRVR
jgi:hypothetical protein